MHQNLSGIEIYRRRRISPLKFQFLSQSFDWVPRHRKLSCRGEGNQIGLGFSREGGRMRRSSFFHDCFLISSSNPFTKWLIKEMLHIKWNSRQKISMKKLPISSGCNVSKSTADRRRLFNPPFRSALPPPRLSRRGTRGRLLEGVSTFS